MPRSYQLPVGIPALFGTENKGTPRLLISAINPNPSVVDVIVNS
jgi:hypothetical protein